MDSPQAAAGRVALRTAGASASSKGEQHDQLSEFAAVSLRSALARLVRGHVRRRYGWYDRWLTRLGALSNALELRVRRRLQAPAELVVVRVSPRGERLAHPLVMQTRRGTEQIATSLAFHGWVQVEPPFPALLETLLAVTKGAFVDIGANTGVYSLLVTSLEPSRPVIAFEPFPTVADMLEANLGRNADGASVRVLRQAASDRAGTATLYVPEQDHGLVETSASLVRDFRSAHSEAVEVALVRGDEALGADPIGLIKIDVEGAEPAALRGLTHILESQRPIVLCEVLRETDTWGEVCNALVPLDYAAAAILKDRLVTTTVKRTDTDNYVLYPEEKASQIDGVAHSAGLAGLFSSETCLTSDR